MKYVYEVTLCVHLPKLCVPIEKPPVHVWVALDYIAAIIQKNDFSLSVG